ncbi:MAG: M1 family metallopeptidase [Chitinophagales bacterium]|jgi:aminopeptidase N|nr:M1 family metallopeptidase [Chitinophagales bacterium]
MRFLSLFLLLSLYTTLLFGQKTDCIYPYDAKHYDLSVFFDSLGEGKIRGTNHILFQVLRPIDSIVIPLSNNFRVTSLNYDEKKAFDLDYRHEAHKIILKPGKKLLPNQDYELKIGFEGFPMLAKNAPWDGGLVQKKDKEGNHFIGIACEGDGASIWWPCFDSWQDEPEDGVDFKITVDSSYTAVANGRLLGVEENGAQKEWHWRVKNPINLYNVNFTIGKMAHFSDTFYSAETQEVLDLDYYVLAYNLEKAKAHFQQVKPMLQIFEKSFGRYPFYEDGYKLVETPYLGMEHQSAIAYGNNYQNGYFGNLNYTNQHEFDYIIIHESGHEWFGNNITAKDPADMWIHEAFTTYSESVYVEALHGKVAAIDYINHHKKGVNNESPIVGPYCENKEGSSDMYAKGSLFINTLRQKIQNDSLFKAILKNMNAEFFHKTIGYEDVLNYWNKQTKLNLTPIFETYLKNSKIPHLQVTTQKTGKNIGLLMNFNQVAKGFSLPVSIFNTKTKKTKTIIVSDKKMTTPGFTIPITEGKDWEINDKLGYFNLILMK